MAARAEAQHSTAQHIAGFCWTDVVRQHGCRCRPLCCVVQDNVWAEQAHLFSDWHGYSSLLSQRAAMADRHWLDSIGLKDTADSTPAAQRRQAKHAIGRPAVAGAAGSWRQGQDSSRQPVRKDRAGAGSSNVLSRTAVWLRRVADRLEAQ